MEHTLSTESRQEFDKIMADKLGLLRNIFVTRTAKFDGMYCYIRLEQLAHIINCRLMFQFY